MAASWEDHSTLPPPFLPSPALEFCVFALHRSARYKDTY